MSKARSTAAELAGQYLWARDLVVSAVPKAPVVLVCGMGGSGISGDFAAAACPDLLVAVHKGYELPGWAALVRPLVVAVSYSGNTEETRSAAEQASEWGLPLAVVSSGGALGAQASEKGWPLVLVPGGLQPRDAFGYLVGGLLRLLESGGMIADQTQALEEAAGVVGELVGDAEGGPAAELAADLAEGLSGRMVLIHGAEGVTKPVAQRWKTQINENAKRPAFWSTLPELDHNEIVGWRALEPLTRRALGLVQLRDRFEHPRVARRFALTRDLIGDGMSAVGEVWSQGESRLARMAGLCVVGDLLSVLLAEQEGVDWVEIDAITELKARLAEE